MARLKDAAKAFAGQAPAPAHAAKSVSIPMDTTDPRLADLFRRGGESDLSRWEAAAGDPWLSVPVAACLRWATANFPSAWLALYTEAAGKGEDDEADYTHPIIRAVGRTRGMSLSERWALSVVSDTVWGETYWLKVRTVGGEIARYQWVPPRIRQGSTRWGMEPIGSRTEEISEFRYWVDGKPKDYPVSEVVYIKQMPDPDDPKRGLAFLRAGLRNMVGVARADTLAADLLGRMTTSKVFIPDQSFMLDDPESEGVRNRYEDSIRLGSNRLPILNVQGRFEDIGRPPTDMGLDFLPGQFVAAICALIGLDPLVIGMGGITRGTFENQAQAHRQGWDNYLIPMQDRLADGITAASRDDFGLGENQYLGWDRTRVPALKESRSQQIADAALSFEKGLLFRDLALTTNGMEPVGPEKGGDLYADGTDGKPAPQPDPNAQPGPANAADGAAPPQPTDNAGDNTNA
mgnify:FL=1